MNLANVIVVSLIVLAVGFAMIHIARHHKDENCSGCALKGFCKK